MTLVLYADHFYYMPSFRYLFDEFRRRKDGISLELVDVNGVDIGKLKEHVERSTVILFDISIFNMIGIGQLPPYFYVKNKHSDQYYVDVWEAVSRSSASVFVFASLLDLHYENFRLSRELFLNVLKRSSGIIWPHGDRPVDVSQVSRQYRSVFSSYRLKEVDLMQIWSEITASVSINIDFPLSVDESELVLADRKKYWDTVVPGAAYSTRVLAKKSMMTEGLRLAPYRNVYRWGLNVPYYIMKRITGAETGTLYHQRTSFSIQNFLIRHSSTSFVCGSEFHYFVRKFLEVPANRSVMIAWPNIKLESYGFKEGVHYIGTLPEEAGKAAKRVLQSVKAQKEIIQNAFQLVKEKHTTRTRVDQLLMAMDRFKKGNLKGLRYRDGEAEIY